MQVSTPGLVGLGPLVSLDGVSVGPRAAERSSALVAETRVSLAPLESLLHGKAMLSADLSGADVSIVQATNYSWFGYPMDTEPSARDFVPGLSATPDSPDPTTAQHQGIDADALSQRRASHDSASTSASAPPSAASKPAPAAPKPAKAPETATGDGPGGGVPVHLSRISVTGGNLAVFATGDPYARRVGNVDASIDLQPGYTALEVVISGDAVARDPASYLCTMPTPSAERNLRDCTPGGEVAPINAYPVTRQGPSPLSLQKMQAGAAERRNGSGNGNSNGSSSSAARGGGVAGAVDALDAALWPGGFGAVGMPMPMDTLPPTMPGHPALLGLDAAGPQTPAKVRA